MPKKPSNKKNRDKKPQRPYVGDYGTALPIPAALLATDASERAATKNAGTNNFEVVSASDCTDASDYADRSGVVCSPASVDNTKADPQDQ